MCGHMPEARLRVLENSGHTPQLEGAHAFHEVTIPFILANPR
jgi:pimeloyl-ACP methyl ester carboxylesterase